MDNKGRENYQPPNYDDISVPASDREVGESINLSQKMGGGLRISPIMRSIIIGACVLGVVVLLIGFKHTTDSTQVAAQQAPLTPSEAYKNASPDARVVTTNDIQFPKAGMHDPNAAVPPVNGQTQTDASQQAEVQNALDTAANQSTNMGPHHGMATPAATLAPLASASPIATDGPGLARQSGDSAGAAAVPNPGSNGVQMPATAPPVSAVLAAADGKNDADDLYVGDGNVGQHSADGAAFGQPGQAPSMQIAQAAPPAHQNAATDTTTNAAAAASAQRAASDYLTSPKDRPLGQFEVWVGTVIPAQLDTAINARQDSIVVAHTINDIYDSKTGQVLVIPKGTRIVGHAGAASKGQYRVSVTWDRLEYPDGSRQHLDGQEGADKEGNAGLYADVKTPNIIAASIFTGLLAGGTQLLAGGTGGGGSVTVSGGQVVGSSVGSSVAQTTGQIIQQKANEAPELTVPRAQQFSVVLDRTMLLEPWVYDDSSLSDHAAGH